MCILEFLLSTFIILKTKVYKPKYEVDEDDSDTVLASLKRFITKKKAKDRPYSAIPMQKNKSEEDAIFAGVCW